MGDRVPQDRSGMNRTRAAMKALPAQPSPARPYGVSGAAEAIASTSAFSPFFGIYLSACPSAVNAKHRGIRNVSVLVMAKTRATFLVHEMAKPPSKLPRGMADHASTLAILITRPSIWFGTIACRRLLV